MNAIGMWAAAVCTAVLAVSLLQFFSPGKKTEGALRVVLGAFVVLSLLSSVSILKDADLSDLFTGEEFDAETKNTQDETEKMLVAQAEKNISSLVAAELQKYGIRFEKLSLVTDTGEDGCILISRILIVLPQEFAEDALKTVSCVENLTGIETEVSLHGTGG